MPWAMFSSQKVLRKEKNNVKKNDFLIFNFIREDRKEIKYNLNLVRNLYILKLFNIWKKKWNEFKVVCNNNWLILNIFLFFLFSFPHIFSQIFQEPNIALEFVEKKKNGRRNEKV